MARGGYRPGSGPKKGTKYKRKSQAPVTQSISEDKRAEAAAQDLDPLAYMLKVMNDPAEDASRRAQMAIAAAPYCHPRMGEGKGKKTDQAERAMAAGTGKFSAGKPPLRIVKRHDPTPGAPDSLGHGDA